MNANTLKDISSKSMDMIVEHYEIIKTIQMYNSDINNKLQSHKELTIKNSNEVDKLNIKVEYANKRLDEFRQETNKKNDDVNKRLDEINERLNSFESKFDKMYDIFLEIAKK